MKRLINKLFFTLFAASVATPVFGNQEALPETMVEAGLSRLMNGISAVAHLQWKCDHQHSLRLGKIRRDAKKVQSQLYFYNNRCIQTTYPYVKIELVERTNGTNIGVCHDYSFKKLMEIDLEDSVNIDPIAEKIVENFEISPKPKPGYLCVYAKVDLVDGKVRLSDVRHTGIVCADGKTIESRYGGAIFKQHVSHVPHTYGDYVVYFKPPSPEQLRLGLGVSGWEGIANVAKMQQNIITMAKLNPDSLLDLANNPHDRKCILAAIKTLPVAASLNGKKI